jgi:hypothetical protein
MDSASLARRSAQILVAEQVDTEKIDTNAGGSGYSWFTAPSDRDIWFIVTVVPDSDATEIQLLADVNTSQTNNWVAQDHDTRDSGQSFTMPMVRVPAGHEYKTRALGDTGSYSIERWQELR